MNNIASIFNVKLIFSQHHATGIIIIIFVQFFFKDLLTEINFGIILLSSSEKTKTRTQGYVMNLLMFQNMSQSLNKMQWVAIQNITFSANISYDSGNWQSCLRIGSNLYSPV